MKFKRIERLPQYVFNLVGQLIDDTRQQGFDVIDFSLGNPDGGTPSFVVDALIQTVQREETHRYSKSKGIDHLLTAFADWAMRRFNVSLQVQDEVVATIGAKEGIAHLVLAITSAKDKVLVPMPCYPIHAHAFDIAECDIHYFEVASDQAQTFENIKTQIESQDIKVLLLNFPSNPTGACVDLDFFEDIIALAKKHNVWVIHDLAYADICFDGYQAPSILQVKGAKDIAVEVFSLSKSYNMPGWRVGFVYGNRELIGALIKLKSYYDYGMFTPIQVAAAKALNEGDAVAKQICQKYKVRRDILHKGLNDIGWMVEKPMSTMFIWAPIPQGYTQIDSFTFTKKLIQEAHVAVSPGIGFGQGGDKFVRFALIEDEPNVKEALKRIVATLDKLPKPIEEKKFGTG